LNDSALYTGVDGVKDGVFGNEELEETTKLKLEEQKRQIAELTPKLQDIIDMLDHEIKLVMSIDRFTTATTKPESDIRSEIQASALYKVYLDNLKTKFALALNEVTK
jgi:hypothetical protein